MWVMEEAVYIVESYHKTVSEMGSEKENVK